MGGDDCCTSCICVINVCQAVSAASPGEHVDPTVRRTSSFTGRRWLRRSVSRRRAGGETARRFVYLIWCARGRFVTRTREGGGPGRNSRQLHCNRVAVEQKFNADWSGENAEFTPWIIALVRIRELLFYATLLKPDFKVHRHIKMISRYLGYISSAQRPAPLRTRYTNRLNSENNRDYIRNVPLPEKIALLTASLACFNTSLHVRQPIQRAKTHLELKLALATCKRVAPFLLKGFFYTR